MCLFVNEKTGNTRSGSFLSCSERSVVTVLSIACVIAFCQSLVQQLLLLARRPHHQGGGVSVFAWMCSA
jgi:hypothetical protein